MLTNCLVCVLLRIATLLLRAAAMGGIFSYTDATVANFRQKDDAINGAVGGCAAGLVLGAAARSVPMMFGGCASLAALIGTFDAAGKSLSGVYARPSPNDFTHSDHDASHGTRELSWKEAREARRQSFFKVRALKLSDTLMPDSNSSFHQCISSFDWTLTFAL